MSLPTLVQSAKAGSSTTVTSLTIAVSAVTLGNLLVVGEAHGSNTSSLGGPSGWTKAVENLPAGVDATGGSSIWYLIVDSGNAGATSFTFTSSTAHTILLGFEEWSSTNGWNTSPLDATATGENEGSPTQHTSIASGTTATTSQATELWFATTVYKSTSQTESGLTSGWTESQEITTSSTYTANIFHEAVSSTGAAGMSYTIGSAAYCAGCVATFKPIVATGEAFVGKATGVATATASLTGTKLTGIALGVASAVAMLTQPPVVAIAPPPFSPIGARYLVRARDMNNNAIDPITTYQRLDLVERFNATSDWSIQLDADDPVAALLVIPGYGITVTRTTYNLITGKVINSRVEMSGPMTGISREMSNNLLIVHGRDDMLSLTRRDAWPTTNFNFGSDVLAFTPAPTLYWRMDATSGTSETDRTGHSNTGTYGTIGTGSYHLNQGSLIDDPDASAAFTGTVGSSTTGAYLKLGSPSPTSVTGSYTVFLVANNGALGSVCGSRGSGDSSFDIQLQSTAPFIHGDIGTGSAWLTTSADSDASVVLPTVGPYIICYVVTPTDYTVYLGGVQVGTGTYASATPVLWDATHTFCVGIGGTNSTCSNAGIDEVIVWNSALTSNQVNVVSAGAQSRLNHQPYDTQTGACETVLKHYVNVNLGAGAFTERQISNFAIEADAAQGATVTGNARFDKLVASDGTGLLQTLALAGGDLGFRIANISGTLTFQVYVPTDRSNTVYFSQALGNLLDFTYTRDAPNSESGGNMYVLGGGGQGTERVFTMSEDPTSIALWGRSEQFQDARDTSDVGVLTQRGDAAILANKEVTTFNAVISPSPQTVFGVHFNLGDKVSAVIDGVVFSDLIREVDISLVGGAAEVVTPIMGTPNAVTITDALWKHFQGISRDINALQRLQTVT